ncbi:MAG TPA: ABC transporter permease [Xanthobacteraceae bacterium]|jgi:cell division transport system permease protein|nr:ABC transporter permease [Xanthobacteraceae bacterium]
MTNAPYEADMSVPTPSAADDFPRDETPIVPATSIAGRALVAVVAIMTFLASLTTGAVMLILASAAEWQSDVAREMTIQVRPAPGRDLDAEVAKAVEIAHAAPGITDVRPYTAAESARLLEPWLGTGLTLDALPVPRIIVLRLGASERPDLDVLRSALAARVAGVSLDDHRGWVDRMRAMANTAIVGGIGILGLVLAATVLSVAFATRGAVATNRPIIEVLHFIGAKDGFIASQFQGHFLMLGLKGGGLGGGAALIVLALAAFFGDWFLGTAAGDETAALFGGFSIGIAGYAAVLGQIVLVAAVTAGTSRQVVNRTLASIA